MYVCMCIVPDKGVFRGSDMRDVNKDCYKQTIDFDSGERILEERRVARGKNVFACVFVFARVSYDSLCERMRERQENANGRTYERTNGLCLGTEDRHSQRAGGVKEYGIKESKGSPSDNIHGVPFQS